MSRIFHLVLWPLVILLTLLPALAQAQSDPPARVGRLAYIENGVNFRVDRSSERDAASINWPISSGAMLDTDWSGRAEVWIGSSAFRVAGNSEVEFAQVDDQQITVNLSVGSLAVSIMDREQADNLSVMTPEGPVHFVTPGRYRIDVLSDHSEVTAQAGQATVDGRNRPVAVAAGQKARLYQGQLPRIDGDFDQDKFDTWVAERENATMANSARRYVSPQMTGYQDLDAHGDWRPEGEYGTVWYPRSVADDWAPYRDGRWAWVAPWGWTWIDQASWGFAPFHYGRWVNINNRWGWAPGRHESRPVYAPALVGWIGNPGWSASFSFGLAPAVGWFPLAPREVYVPAYRYSPNYIRQINVSHVQNVTIIQRAERPGGRENFIYRDRQQAVTVVPANFMREGKSISSGEFRRPERRDLERAPQAQHAPNAAWLAPAAGANRPQPLNQRESTNHANTPRENINARPRREGEMPTRPLVDQRPAPRLPAPAANAPAQPEARPPLPGVGQEQRNQNRRFDQPASNNSPEIRNENIRPENGRPERDRRSPDATMPAPAARENPTAARPIEVTPPVGPARQESPLPRREMPPGQVVPQAGQPNSARPDFAPPRRDVPPIPPTAPIAPQAAPPSPQFSSPISPRDNRSDPRESQRFERAAPREIDPAQMRPREMPTTAPVTRPPVMPTPTPSAPPPMREERRPAPIMPNQEREQRRDFRDNSRVDRSMPREPEAPTFRQRESAPMPQAAPAPAPIMRAPPVLAAPQPAAPPAAPMQIVRPAPPAMPQPQAAPPQMREMPKPSPQGGNPDNARRRDQGDDRGDRGGERGPR